MLRTLLVALAPAALAGLASCGPQARPAPAPRSPAPEAPSPAPAAPAPAAPEAPVAGYTGLGAESVSAELIARFAPPPLAPAVSARIQAMLDVRGVGGGVLTRKADRMFFTWNVTGTNQVWRQDGAMSFPVQLTGGEDRTSVVALAPDDSFVVVSRDVGGQENPGLYCLDPDGGALEEIHRKDKVQTFLAFVSDDSKSVWYLANDRDPASYALYRWDVATRTAEAVFTEPGIWRVFDHAGDRVLLAKLLGNTHVEVHEYDLARKELRPITGQGEAEQHDARYGAAGTILIRTNKLGDFHRVYAWKDGALTPVTPELGHDVQSFSIDHARKRLYFVVNEGGYFRSFALDARTYKPVALPKLPAADNVLVGGASRDGRHVQLSYSAATRPSTAVVYDWTTKKLTTWRVPSAPEIDVSRFTAPTLEHVPARDGTKVPMFVWRATGCAGPCPVVVDYHGGPEGQSTAGFNPYAQLFVDAGFTFVQPNVRGSTGYGKAWLHADNGPRRLHVITDVEDVANHIRSAWAIGGVAPKIGVMGGSYGGYTTLMAMTYFAGAYDAGVSEVGISNLVTFLENTAPYRRILRATEYGDPDKDRDALIQLSPTTHLDKLAAPLLIIQGVNDPRVPVGEAVQLWRAMEARQIEGGLILFADEGHGTAKRSNRVLALGHTIAFFEQHLK